MLHGGNFDPESRCRLRETVDIVLPLGKCPPGVLVRMRRLPAMLDAMPVREGSAELLDLDGVAVGREAIEQRIQRLPVAG